MQNIGDKFNSQTEGIYRGKIHRPPLEQDAHCEKHGAYLAKCHLGSVWTKCQQCHAEGKQAEEKARIDQQAADKLQEWKNKVQGAGIPERFKDSRFSTYEVSEGSQKAVLDAVKGYARDWVKNSTAGRSLVFVGSVGTGKNHLACSVASHIMYHHQATVLFRTLSQMTRSIRDTWAKGSNRSESDVIKELVSPQLLILDEIQDANGSKWEQKVLFDVLDERYLAKKPVLIIGNMKLDELKDFLGERIVDRMTEDGAQFMNFSWESARPRIGAALSV